MNLETRPEELDAVLAANQIARRAALLSAAAGRRNWWRPTVYLLSLGATVYIAWKLTYPWNMVALILFFVMQAQVQILESQMSRRLDAIVALLEEPVRSLPREGKGGKEKKEPA